jgi:hypothetical protein
MAKDTPETANGGQPSDAASATGNSLLRDLLPADWQKARQSGAPDCNPREVGIAKPLVWHSGFEMSPAEITAAGLDTKVDAYKAKVTEAMDRLGANYKIDLRIIDRQSIGPHGTPLDSDVWTEVVRNPEMRNEAFVINVTAKFLRDQPEILFESSSLHEVSHIMNDDLNGYHRQGGNIEMAEERRVADTVGFPRYEEYLRAYTNYNPKVKFDSTLQKVKDVALVPPPVESDDADKSAAEYLKTHADGKEHLLVYNGQLHDVTLSSTAGSVTPDLSKLQDVIKQGKPMVIIHNHPSDGAASLFPSHDDFGVAGNFLSLALRENPSLPVEFRVLQMGQNEVSSVAYGFKGAALADLKANADAYRNARSQNQDLAPIEMKQKLLSYHLAQDSYNEYLKHAYLLEVARTNSAACRVRPQYFLWPSDRFFVKDRPQS